MSPKRAQKPAKRPASKKKIDATWQIWGGIDLVSLGTRPSGRPHTVMLVREYGVMGSEKEARAVTAMNGGGALVLRTHGRILKKIDVPAAVERRRDGQVRTDACATSRAPAPHVVSATDDPRALDLLLSKAEFDVTYLPPPTIEVKDTGDGVDWRLIVNGYGVAMWSGAVTQGSGRSAREYAEEVARVLRLALRVPRAQPVADPVLEAFKNAPPRTTPLSKEQRVARELGLAAMRRGDSIKTPASHMTLPQLRDEHRREVERSATGRRATELRQEILRRRDVRTARVMTSAALYAELQALGERFANRGEHGGSPGEWLVERMGEIEDELTRRKLPLTQKASRRR